MSAWYIETWVKAPTPVTSPTAHTPSVTRRWSSTASAWAASSMPMLVDVEGGEVGPSPRGHEQALAGDRRLPLEVEHEAPPPAS